MSTPAPFQAHAAHFEAIRETTGKSPDALVPRSIMRGIAAGCFSPLAMFCQYSSPVDVTYSCQEPPPTRSFWTVRVPAMFWLPALVTALLAREAMLMPLMVPVVDVPTVMVPFGKPLHPQGTIGAGAGRVQIRVPV